MVWLGRVLLLPGAMQYTPQRLKDAGREGLRCGCVWVVEGVVRGGRGVDWSQSVHDKIPCFPKTAGCRVRGTRELAQNLLRHAEKVSFGSLGCWGAESTLSTLLWQ